MGYAYGNQRTAIQSASADLSIFQKSCKAFFSRNYCTISSRIPAKPCATKNAGAVYCIEKALETLTQEQAAQVDNNRYFQSLWLEEAKKPVQRDYPDPTDIWDWSNRPNARLGAALKTNAETQVTPDRSILNKMKNDLLGLSSQSRFTSKEIKFIKAVQAEVERQLRSKTVAYGDYINICHYFEVTMSMKTETRFWIESNSYQIDPTLSRDNWMPHLKLIVEQAPRVMVAPTFRDLTDIDFNEMRPYPIYHLGLSSQPNAGLNMNPLEFLNHDVSHAIDMSTVDFSDAGLMKSGPSAIKAFKARERFYNSFKESLKTVKNKLLSQMIQECWFFVFHEEALPFTREGLQKAFALQDPSFLKVDRIIEESPSLKGLTEKQKVKVVSDALQWLRKYAESDDSL